MNHQTAKKLRKKILIHHAASLASVARSAKKSITSVDLNVDRLMKLSLRDLRLELDKINFNSSLTESVKRMFLKGYELGVGSVNA